MWCARPADQQESHWSCGLSSITLVRQDYIQIWSVCWVKSLVEKCTHVRRDSSNRVWMLAPTALVVKTYGNSHLALEVGDNGPLANKPSNSQNRSKLLRISGAVGVARTVALCWAMEECIISISSHIMACDFTSCLSCLPCLEKAWSCMMHIFSFLVTFFHPVPSTVAQWGWSWHPRCCTSSPTPLTSISFIQGARRGHWHSGLQQWSWQLCQPPTICTLLERFTAFLLVFRM